MKVTRVTCCLCLLVLSLVAFTFFTAAPKAQAGASGSTFVSRFHGLSAFADFDSFSPGGCIETFVFVNGTQNGSSQEADVFIGQVNNCAPTPLSGGGGGGGCGPGAILCAFGSTFSPAFQVGKSLETASLSATISVFDFVSGNTFNVSVSMTWTATGPLSSESGSSHFRTKNFIENFHFNNTFRDASASGTVSDGTTNFTPSPSVFAQTASFKSGDVTITHS